MTTYLYHISKEGSSLDEGYIGVSVNPDLRFRKHRRNARNPNKKHRAVYRGINENSDITYRILACGEEDYIYELERALRPVRNMGWNTISGGYASSRF